MIIDLGILSDGGVVMVSSEPFPEVVKRVEYYKDQKLFNIVYHEEPESSDLMHREVKSTLIPSVEKSPDVLIFSLFIDEDPIGYKVPLIHIGEDPLF